MPDVPSAPLKSRHDGAEEIMATVSWQALQLLKPVNMPIFDYLPDPSSQLQTDCYQIWRI